MGADEARNPVRAAYEAGFRRVHMKLRRHPIKKVSQPHRKPPDAEGQLLGLIPRRLGPETTGPLLSHMHSTLRLAFVVAANRRLRRVLGNSRG
jgi:hypothetical protein